MNANQEIGRAPAEGALDTAKLVLATIFVAGGIVAFYWFVQMPVWQRTLMVAAGAVASVLLGRSHVAPYLNAGHLVVIATLELFAKIRVRVDRRELVRPEGTYYMRRVHNVRVADPPV